MTKQQIPNLNVLPETRELALELVAAGKISKATGLIRKATRADRQDAAAYVEALKAELIAQRVPVELEGQARGLLAGGKPIDAIKLVVNTVGLSLKDGKLYIDALREGRIAWRTAEQDGRLSERVRAFEAADDHASAVALVQTETGMSATEAERFISALK